MYAFCLSLLVWAVFVVVFIVQSVPPNMIVKDDTIVLKSADHDFKLSEGLWEKIRFQIKEDVQVKAPTKNFSHEE